MEIAKISSKGQITLPKLVRERLHLGAGDKVFFFEDREGYRIENAAEVAFRHVEEGFQGAAAEAGFVRECDLQYYAKDIRNELRG